MLATRVLGLLWRCDTMRDGTVLVQECSPVQLLGQPGILVYATCYCRLHLIVILACIAVFPCTLLIKGVTCGMAYARERLHVYIGMQLLVLMHYYLSLQESKPWVLNQLVKSVMQ